MAALKVRRLPTAKGAGVTNVTPIQALQPRAVTYVLLNSGTQRLLESSFFESLSYALRQTTVLLQTMELQL